MFLEKIGKFRKQFKISAVVQFLTYSDVLMMSGWGMVNPILAVFFSDHIIGGDLKFAGLASTIYFLVKSLFQIPIARYIDKHKGEKDDYIFMIIGSVLISLSAFLFVLAKYPWHVYIIQVIYGFGGAFSFPTWMALFTRHVDKNKEGLEWSLYYTSVDIGTALAAGLGGFIASTFGYQILFWIVGMGSVLGTFMLIGIKDEINER